MCTHGVSAGSVIIIRPFIIRIDSHAHVEILSVQI